MQWEWFTIFRPPCWCPTEEHQHDGSILGSVIKFVQNIWSNIWSLGKRADLHVKLGEVFSLSTPITSQFLDFIHWMVFELFFFYCVTVRKQKATIQIDLPMLLEGDSSFFLLCANCGFLFPGENLQNIKSFKTRPQLPLFYNVLLNQKIIPVKRQLKTPNTWNAWKGIKMRQQKNRP